MFTYLTKPAQYVSYLIGHEGEGSLLSALKAKSWCNSLVCGKRDGAKGFDFFNIVMDLTEEGVKHIDDIVTMTFQYINMLKKTGPIEWIFNVSDKIMKYIRILSVINKKIFRIEKEV